MQLTPDDSDIFLGGLSQAFLRRLLWTVVLLNIALGIQSAWANDFALARYLDNLSVAVISFIGLYILPRNGFRAALGWMLWATWVTLAVFMGLRSGLRDPTALAFPLLIVLTGWLLGRRPAVVMVCATTVVAVGLAVAEAKGYLAQAPVPSYTMLTTVFLAILLIGSLISLAVARSVTMQHRRVTELNQSLELRIAERTAHLERVNQELASTLHTLQRAQSELVQSEKLASLGSMVAGVAHELNTPIGNAVTAASTLAFKVQEFATQAQNSSMRRSSINEFVAGAQDLSQLLLRSTQRAADLVTSFKRVAVDRTSEHRRSFDIRKAIDELMTALEPTIKRSPWEVHVHGTTGLVVDSYPGPFEQVISNLVINATQHAFEGREQGRIDIRISRGDESQTGANEGHADRICIAVSDDGCGMEAKAMQRIFEPFFTTKLGRGGSGLGLSISYNIVTSLLGGALEVSSGLGQGSTFLITIPMRAPDTPLPG